MSFFRKYNTGATLNDVLRERERDVQLLGDMQRALKNITDGQALYLMSPDGARWKITVDNAGTLTTEAM